jgi:homoserine dehydrogenase
MSGDIIVLKFGGSVLRSEADVPTAVHEIYRWYRAGWRVVAIVSAIGDATQKLIEDARQLADDPQPHAMAELLASGERRSAALLGIALDRAGIPARVIDPREVGLTVSGTVLDSETSAVQAGHVQALLEHTPVLVVSGFGYGADGRLQLLGPGGSDLSAVYLANALRANRCRLLKDVDGVYEADPAQASSPPLLRFSALGYADALELAGPLIQPKAVRLLDRYSARAEVAAIASPYESVIGRFERTTTRTPKAPPTVVLLLGLGTIGLGIHRRLCAMPEHFTICGALVRDSARHAAHSASIKRFYDSFHAVAQEHPDVVVDALPGVEPSLSIVSHFLERGISVVSANRCLITEAGKTLGTLAAKCNAYLRYGAAVGGSAPMLEALRREVQRDDVRSIALAPGGPCAGILDLCAAGSSFEDAVRAFQPTQARSASLTEELTGAATVRQLRILARHAFGRDPDALHVEELNETVLARGREALREDSLLRRVARVWKISHRIFGQFQLEVLDRDAPLAHLNGDWNRLIITRSNGAEIVIEGRRAGRWPMTEAAMADLLDVRFAHLALTRNADAG